MVATVLASSSRLLVAFAIHFCFFLSCAALPTLFFFLGGNYGIRLTRGTESRAADRRAVSFVAVAEIRICVQVLEVSTHQLQDVVNVCNAADHLVP